MSDIIGSARLITFSTTRDDHPFLTPLLGMLTGNTTGHAALLLTFNDQELFDKYIANNDKIPHRVRVDSRTQKPYFEVYISFWPQTDAGLSSQPSMFVKHEFDLESSAMYSPFEYDDKWLGKDLDSQPVTPELTTEQVAAAMAPLVLEASELRRVRDLLHKSHQKAPLKLEPIERISSPGIPVLSHFIKSKAHLGPMIVVHSTRLEHDYNPSVVKLVTLYAQQYRLWRALLVYGSNAGQTESMVILCTRLAKVYEDRVKQSEKLLHLVMFPKDTLTHDQFIAKMDPYMTIGKHARDSFMIPIVRNIGKDNVPALELEPMLKYVCEIAANPNMHLYNLLKFNCAAVTYKTLMAGAKNSNNMQLKKYLALAWYVNLLGVTLTPTMLIQNASRADNDKPQTSPRHRMLKFRVSADNEFNTDRRSGFNPNTFI